MNYEIKKIVVLGATGSVGRDVIEVVRQNPGRFKIVGLSCKSQVEMLRTLAEEFSVEKICQGDDCLDSFLGGEIDLVVNCIAGENGTEITKKALSLGINVALANKEALVSDGAELIRIADKNGAVILPIDSEICALHQCLRGIGFENGKLSHSLINQNVEKVILTASGGPFFGKSREEMEGVNLEEALNHPTWPNMGRKITIDSATLMNKAFEIIETAVLFGLPPDKIEVLVHPESKVHGIVYLKDGNVIMHASAPDMKIPVSYCLFYPELAPNTLPRLNLKKTGKLEFFEPDTETFPAIFDAYTALKNGRTKEFLRISTEKTKKFINGEIGFTDLLDRLF